MSCNAVDLQNVYFWLVLAAGGIGGAAGVLLKAGWRRLQSTYGRRGGLLKWGARRRSGSTGAGVVVKVSLLLSGAALAALGAIVFLDLPQIDWGPFVLLFFILAVLGWTIFYIAFRWLVIPLVLAVVLYIVLVSGVVRQWNCCQPEDELLRVKVIAQRRADAQILTRIELFNPATGRTDFQEIAGDSLKVVLSTVNFKPWLFYPRCAFLFRIHSLTGENAGADDGGEISTGSLAALLKIGAADIEQLEVVQPQLEVLRTYVLVSEQQSPEFETLQ